MRLCTICATNDEARYVDIVREAFRKPCGRCGEPTFFEMAKRISTPAKKKKVDVEEELLFDEEDQE